ncbi:MULTISPECIES: polysaccharide deacetylase family protein [Pseudoalteromonas]|uniref:Polysaccharide deacetylase family protein n=1 Tax=Pseudoalteromonas obscura TaxID=3048491 RepID=A0ABT7EU50_9GAMM|nr:MULTISPECIES: polysaccharide deacetylase family protein [Pseudoalteromonas]MBQ4839972.1 polysaccharide deacetylase family protein [Pseudoalteromonas luteoviolacea]MDK2598576.1 polysaccharide deacetylase family protein [Pseudoalteromonas sp. P94(2023)]
MGSLNTFSKLVAVTLLTLSHSSFATVGEAASEAIGFSYPNGARYAISLSFDDARSSQVDVGLPILDKHGVKGTFYINPQFAKERLAGWKAAVKNGHELGNHTSSHLCTGNFEWLRKDNLGLEQVDLAWLKRDIESTTQFMKQQLEVTPRSFAYPCGNTFVGRGVEVQSYVPLVAELFKTGRTWLDETGNNPTYTDFAQLAGNRMDGMSFSEIKEMLDLLKEENKWIILAGHDVGEKGLYTVDKEALNALIVYLKDPKNGYWLATVDEVATYIEKHR